MVHVLSQLDPMVWLMMIVVAVGFAVAALVLVDLLPGDDDAPAAPPGPGVASDDPPPDARAGREVTPP
jgi:hypothetical protein